VTLGFARRAAWKWRRDITGDQLTGMRMPQRVEGYLGHANVPGDLAAVWRCIDRLQWSLFESAEQQRVVRQLADAKLHPRLKKLAVFAQYTDGNIRQRDVPAPGLGFWQLDSDSVRFCFFEDLVHVDHFLFEIDGAVPQREVEIRAGSSEIRILGRTIVRWRLGGPVFLLWSSDWRAFGALLLCEFVQPER
jgi:hypothetical protein